jgi:flagellar hook-basal body complex protein FliE
LSLSPVSLAGAAFSSPEGGSLARAAGPGAGAAPFSGLVDHFLGGAVQSDLQAASAVRDLAAGRTDNLHDVMRQVAQADISFRLVLEIRNKLTDAYQEIMKMQV